MNRADRVDRARRWARDPGGRSWVVLPVVIASLSRFYSVALIRLVDASNQLHHPSPFVAWDGRWYLSIAATGYHAAARIPGVVDRQHDFAFFPLWPIVIKLATLGMFDAATMSVLVANGLFVVAAVLIWKLLAERFRPALASETIWLLAFAPPAFVFSLAYSEPLFLVLAAGYFLSRTHPARRGVLIALAMLTRIAGVAIIASAAVNAARATGRERRFWLLTIAGGIAAFAGWALYIAVLVHDPLGFMHGSPSFSSSPGLVEVLRAFVHLEARRLGALAFTSLILVGGLLMLRRDRELGTYAVVAVALGLLPGGVVWSMPRYCLVAFPAFAGLADRLGRRGTVLLLVGFAVAQWFFVRSAIAYPGAEAP